MRESSRVLREHAQPVWVVRCRAAGVVRCDTGWINTCGRVECLEAPLQASMVVARDRIQDAAGGERVRDLGRRRRRLWDVVRLIIQKKSTVGHTDTFDTLRIACKGVAPLVRVQESGQPARRAAGDDHVCGRFETMVGDQFLVHCLPNALATPVECSSLIRLYSVIVSRERSTVTVWHENAIPVVHHRVVDRRRGEVPAVLCRSWLVTFARAEATLATPETVVQTFTPSAPLVVDVPLVRSVPYAFAHVHHPRTPVKADSSLLLRGVLEQDALHSRVINTTPCELGLGVEVFAHILQRGGQRQCARNDGKSEHLGRRVARETRARVRRVAYPETPARARVTWPRGGSDRSSGSVGDLEVRIMRSARGGEFEVRTN